MRKIFLSIFLLLAVVCFAVERDTALYKGFPVYPVSIAEEYKNVDSVHIKVPLSSYGYLDDARMYVVHAAKDCGWTLLDESIDDPLTYVFSKGDDPAQEVHVIFNRGIDAEGRTGDRTYFKSPGGSIEYAFFSMDSIAEYSIEKIVTKTMQKAKDAYVRILKGESFESVAQDTTISRNIKDTARAVPGQVSMTVKEAMRLMPGQMSDVYQEYDGRYYIIKLAQVTRGGNVYQHRGQNTEDRRPRSAKLTYTGKESSLDEIKIDAVSRRAQADKVK